MKNNTIYLAIVYINIALYATCFTLQRPLEPFLVEKLKTANPDIDSADEYARLQSFFSIVQTVGSLVTGYFLDRISAKNGFYVSFLASAASYFLLSQATSMNLLYVSKIPTVFQAGYLCAQLAVSQSTSDGSERMTALARLTMSYTVGMVIGPALGGFLGATGDYYLGARLAVAGSLLSALLTFFLPKLDLIDSSASKPASDKAAAAGAASSSTTPPPSPSSTASSESASPSKPSNAWTTVIGVVGKVWLLLGTKVVTSVANSMNASAFPLILKNTYGYKEAALGTTMSYMSGLNAIFTGLFLTPFMELLGGKLTSVVSSSLLGMTLFFVLQAAGALPAMTPWVGDGLYLYLVTSFVLTVFQYTLSPVITGESTVRVDQNEKGTLLGLEHSLFAAARVVSPQIGIHLWKTGGIPYVSGACAGVFGAVLLVWESCRHTLQHNTSKKGA